MPPSLSLLSGTTRTASPPASKAAVDNAQIAATQTAIIAPLPLKLRLGVAAAGDGFIPFSLFFVFDLC